MPLILSTTTLYVFRNPVHFQHGSKIFENVCSSLTGALVAVRHCLQLRTSVSPEVHAPDTVYDYAIRFPKSGTLPTWVQNFRKCLLILDRRARCRSTLFAAAHFCLP